MRISIWTNFLFWPSYFFKAVCRATLAQGPVESLLWITDESGPGNCLDCWQFPYLLGSTSVKQARPGQARGLPLKITTHCETSVCQCLSVNRVCLAQSPQPLPHQIMKQPPVFLSHSCLLSSHGVERYVRAGARDPDVIRGIGTQARKGGRELPISWTQPWMFPECSPLGSRHSWEAPSQNLWIIAEKQRLGLRKTLSHRTNTLGLPEIPQVSVHVLFCLCFPL